MSLLVDTRCNYNWCSRVAISSIIRVSGIPLSRFAVVGLVLLRYVLIFYDFFCFYVNIFTITLEGLRDDEILNLLSDGTVSGLDMSMKNLMIIS